MKDAQFFEDIYQPIYDIILIPVSLLGILLPIIWDVYFVKKIKYYTRLYHACAEKGKSDPFDNYSIAALHHKSEIIKYIFLLISNITEFSSFIIVGISGIIINSETKFYGKELFFNVFISQNCTSSFVFQDSLDSKLISGNPMYSALLAIGRVGFILSMAFGICLLKYLHVTYHSIDNSPYRFIKLFLVGTCVIGVLLVIIGSVPQLIILSELIRPIITLIYFGIWVKYSRIFYRTLKWRTIEFRIRDGRDWIIRRSVISRYQFLLFMSIMIFSAGLLIINDVLGAYFFLFATGIYYGPCIFNYLYGTPYYQPLVSTQQQIHVFQLCHHTMLYIVETLTIISTVLIASEYVFGTILFFGGILREKLRYRFGLIRTRYTPELNHHLLSNQVN